MQRRARRASDAQGELTSGAACQINIVELDRLNGDASSLTVVVFEKTSNGMYRLVYKAGVLKRFLTRIYVEPLPMLTLGLVSLEDVFKN